ncbi:hypothetical protein [Sinomonas sp. G460-2]|uniref:hypothetical protein n=1 Tax=Sinomonas sp. G460-2 TaxID=3393464 RepID=UPI0039EEA785
MQDLTDWDTGLWQVTTAAGSIHLFELRADGTSTVTRLPHQAEPMSDRDLIADLRRDGECLPLVGISRLTVGTDGAFYLRVRTHGVVTLRMTTTVVSIERVEES